MPKQALTQAEFLELNPLCCFCGGAVPATTRDHVPPRIAFHNKEWPEGFEFPACEACNGGTKLLDQEFALLCAYGGFEGPVSPSRMKQFTKTFTGVLNNNPSLAIGLRMTSNQKRHAMKRLGRSLPLGSTYNEQPIIKLPPKAELAHEVLAFKLGCALHYRHFKKALPQTGKVANAMNTNFSVITEGISEDFLKVTTLAPPPMRGKKNLRGQFEYRFTPPNDMGVGVYICKFGDSFQLNILTLEHPERVEQHVGSVAFVKDFLKGVDQKAKALETLSTHLMMGGPWP